MDRTTPLPVVATAPARRRLPPWLKRPMPSEQMLETRRLIDGLRLNTVCVEARCPNLTECWSRGTATFMILGEHCTRRCGFCAVGTARPEPVEPDEPERLAEAAAHLGLRHVVITSVARDDLEDEGAGHFAACVVATRRRLPHATIEVLVPDFHGRRELIRIVTKSGVMVGLGETFDELEQTFRDLRAHGCRMLTIGQYLRPGDRYLDVQRYYTPAEFSELGRLAESLGFDAVASGPFVRSSYFAETLFAETDVLRGA